MQGAFMLPASFCLWRLTLPQKALRDHVDDDEKTVNESFTVNGTPAILINESGWWIGTP